MSTFEMERLIAAAVRARPQLYRKDHELYTDLESKHQAWREIAADVYPTWQSIPRAETYELVLLLQKKWRSLRDAFNRELRLMVRGGGVRSRKRYHYYKHLKFLKGDDDGQNSKESSDDDPLLQSRPRPKRRRRRLLRVGKRRTNKRELEQGDEEMETVAIHDDDDEEECQPNEESTDIFAETEQRDSDRLFLLSYAEEMCRLPAHVRMWARTQISKVMQEAVAYCCTEEHGGGGGGGGGGSGACAAPAPSGLSDVLDLDATERVLHTTKTTSN